MTYGEAIAAEHSIEAGVNKVPGQEGARPSAPCGATKQCAQYWRERTVRGSFASSTLCCPGTGTLTFSVTAMLGSTDLSVTKWRSLRRTVVRCPDFSPFYVALSVRIPQLIDFARQTDWGRPTISTRMPPRTKCPPEQTEKRSTNMNSLQNKQARTHSRTPRALWPVLLLYKEGA